MARTLRLKRFGPWFLLNKRSVDNKTIEPEFVCSPLRPSRRGGFLPRASHRTGLVGPHPALQADCLKTAPAASKPPQGESRAIERGDLPSDLQTMRFHTPCECHSSNYVSNDLEFRRPFPRPSCEICRDVTGDGTNDVDVSSAEPATLANVSRM